MSSLSQLRMLLAGLVVLAASLSAQQATAPESAVPIARPAYESGTGPVVAIDEAHKNTHTYASPQFQGLLDLLRRYGYRVRPFPETITGQSLSGINVLIVSGPGGWDGPDASLSEGEAAALVDWIRGGGSLLFILDRMPAPIGNIIFWREDFFPGEEPTVAPTGPGGGTGYQSADAMLAKHLITEGRSSDERVRRVATFVGSVFQPPPGAEALMIVPRRAISPTPKTPGAGDVRVDAQRTPVGEWLQGAVMRIGQGRVAIFGETGFFSGGPAADNRQFVLNVMHWLSRVL